MNDTTPRAEAVVRALLKAKTPSERLGMTSDMFDAVRGFITASLAEHGVEAGSLEWKIALLDRMYGEEISASHRSRLVARWSRDNLNSPAR